MLAGKDACEEDCVTFSFDVGLVFVVALEELLQTQNSSMKLLSTSFPNLRPTYLVLEVIMVDDGFDLRNCILSRANSFWTI